MNQDFSRQLPRNLLIEDFLHRQGDDSRRAAMRTRPRMVADLSAAFVTFDEGHNSECWLGFIWFCHLSVNSNHGSLLEIQLQAHGQGSRARKLVVKVERVQIVILAGDVEQADCEFSFSMQETVTGKRVELPEIITRFTGGGVAAVVLTIPIGLSPGKETAGMIVNRRQTQLLQNPLRPLAWYYWIGNI